MITQTNNPNRGKSPMTETAIKAAQERINYYTRLVLAFLALLAVMSGGLIAEIRSGDSDILSTIGIGLAVSLSVTAGYLVGRINGLIKKLEEQ